MKLKKYLPAFLCFSLCFSCQKQTKFESIEAYEKLIGKWESIDGDLTGQVIIKKKGKVITHYGNERGERFQASRINLQNTSANYYNTVWKVIAMERLNNDDEYVDGTAIFFNATFDTILKESGAFNPPPMSKIKFIRYVRE